MSFRAHDMRGSTGGPPLVLTIAGSDSCGGAGMQADLRTLAAFGLRGASAITALTAQDPREVRGIVPTAPAFVMLQARTVLDGEPVATIKVGMLVNTGIVSAVADLLAELGASPGGPALVVDPVMVASSGATLLDDDGVALLVERIFPLADIVTPNLPEAARILGETQDDACRWSRDDQESAARRILDFGPRAVLVKGGHRPGAAADVLVERGAGSMWFESPRVDVDAAAAHGTGCVLSAGVAAGLALGWSLPESVARAKAHLFRVLGRGLDVPLIDEKQRG